jgi:integrase
MKLARRPGRPTRQTLAPDALADLQRSVTFSFHDLRHYLASLLIASGADVKVVQARLRHASAKTTLDTYGHLWPDADESTRAAVATVIREHTAAGQ